MTKSKSPLTRGLRVLYMIPLVCICIGLQAQTVSDSGTTLDPRDYSNGGSTPVVGVYKAYPSTPLYILRQPWGEEKELTKEEFEKIDQSRISKIEVLQPDVAKEKYGDRAAQGAVVFTMKRPQELDEIVVVSYRDQENDELVPFYLVTTDTMPSFQGEGMQGFAVMCEVENVVVLKKWRKEIGDQLMNDFHNTFGEKILTFSTSMKEITF